MLVLFPFLSIVVSVRAYFNEACVVVVDATTTIVMELEGRVPPSAVMDVMSILYPQAWMEDGHEDKLLHRIVVLKANFGQTRLL